MTTFTYTLTVQLPDDDPTDREDLDAQMEMEGEAMQDRWNADLTDEAKVRIAIEPARHTRRAPTTTA